MPALARPTCPVQSPRDAVLAASREAAEYLVGREAEYRACWLGLLSRQNVLLLSPPGTAKSALADVLFRQLGVGQPGREHECFRLLCSPFTAPEELWGPISLPALEREEYVRVQGGQSLRRAEAAFLDEVGKLGVAQQAALLTAMQERAYDNGTKGRERLPLRFVISASNEEIEQEALRDRYQIRAWVEPLAGGPTGEDPDYLRLLAQDFADPRQIRPTLSWALVDAACLEVAALAAQASAAHKAGAPGARRFFAAFAAALAGCARAKIVPSNRTVTRLLTIIAAEAWLDGAAEVQPRHLRVLELVLWRRPEERAVIRRAVLAVAGGEAQALACEDQIRVLAAKVKARGIPDAEAASALRSLAAEAEGYRAEAAEVVDRALNAAREAQEAIAGRVAWRR